MKQTWNGTRKKLESAHTVSSRSGFFYGKPSSDAQIYDSNTYVKNYTYLGTVESIDENGRSVFEQKNKFTVGETIERMKPDGTNVSLKVIGILMRMEMRRRAHLIQSRCFMLYLMARQSRRIILRSTRASTEKQ